MPYAEELVVGVPLPVAPAITLDDGLAAQYQAITGDSLRATLSAPLSIAMTGAGRLVNPALILQIAIGQSTVATRRVIANLSYRNAILRRQMFIGATLTTVVTPLAAARSRDETRAKVLLGMRCTDQDGNVVAEFQRLALIPVNNPSVFTAVGDVGTATTDLPLADFVESVPVWDLTVLLDHGSPDLPARTVLVSDPMAETVTSAVELVRITQNMAMAHRDPQAGQGARRLVYGGHTVGLAQASLTRQLPQLATIIGWRSCDHLAPVFEGDILEFNYRVNDTLTTSHGTLAGLQVQVHARRDDTLVAVLEWHPVALLPTIEPN